jgi:hypothetical protein
MYQETRENIIKYFPPKEGFISFSKQRLFYYINLNTSFILDSPEKSYLRLSKEHPKIMERIPQHCFATYPGITPVPLSRIKGRIRNNIITTCFKKPHILLINNRRFYDETKYQ